MPEETIIPETNSPAVTNYMPQLDSLRTFAVFFVLLSHWIPQSPTYQILPFGEIGVTLFFVLSGFLITQILLKSRNDAEENKISKFHSVKQFYIRRTLRIFPVYYVTILILFIFNVQEIRSVILWFVFYASNFYFYFQGSWQGSLSHLWTLAVEEQFYIIWPFVTLFIPKKYLLRVIIAIIFIGPVSRSILLTMNTGTSQLNFSNLLMPTCMDAFGLGAILAYFRVYKDKAYDFKNVNFKLSLTMYVSILTLVLILKPSLLNMSFIMFNTALLSLFLISKASLGFNGFMKIILENRVLMYLGKISYGLYLLHAFILILYFNSGLPVIKNLILKFIIQGTALILLASISWFVLERPINNLKRYFVYD